MIGKIVIIGVGNLLMGDDGIGIHVIEALRKEKLPSNVALFDGATMAFDVLEYMDESDRAVIVDACKKGGASGSIYRFSFDPVHEVQDSALNLSMHDINFLDAIKAGNSIYRLPSEIVIIGIEPETLECGFGLSAKLTKSLPAILEAVKSELMEDKQYAILRKEDFNSVISILAKLHKLAAPVFKGYNNYAFEEVRSGEEIALKYIPTILPPKKFFMQVHETLLEYDIGKGRNAQAVTEYEKMLLFGVHTCDLAGIQCLNIVFSQHPQDHNYLNHKQNIKIIGLECNEYCDEFANCCLMNTHMSDGGYDLFFTDLGEYFIVHINTPAGEEIIESAGFFKNAQKSHLSELASFREKKKALFKNELPIELDIIPDLFDRSFESKVWDDLDERCLACGNCTNVCPTCYCFDIKDEINLRLSAGKWYRVWDSCQLGPFAKVAGGKNFRNTRKVRQRHRYYRKFRYPIDRFSRFFCTGCGRCSRTCMAGIRLKETLKFLLGIKEG